MYNHAAQSKAHKYASIHATENKNKKRTVASSKDKDFFSRLDVIGRMHVARARRSPLDRRLIPPERSAAAADFQNVHVAGGQRSLTEPTPQDNDAAREVAALFVVVLVLIAVVVLVGGEGCGMPVAAGWRISRHGIREGVAVVVVVVVATATDSGIKAVVVVPTGW
jgi:hypothetical protein